MEEGVIFTVSICLAQSGLALALISRKRRSILV